MIYNIWKHYMYNRHISNLFNYIGHNSSASYCIYPSMIFVKENHMITVWHFDLDMICVTFIFQIYRHHIKYENYQTDVK